VLSTGACIRVKVFGKGSHGSMPHLGVDPVVLSAAIVTRLQTIVAREIGPGDFGVVTVGSLQAGTKANIIPDDATMLLNIRAYDLAVRDTLLAAIERIVRAECDAAGSPRPPEIELYESYPLTDNDEAVTAKVTKAFIDHFGEDRVRHLSPVPASEDFSVIPDAYGIPYCYWGFGGFTADQQPVPNHNPGFGPAMQPTLTTGTEAAVTAVLAYLGGARA
jgi:hippurate hydrolase